MRTSVAFLKPYALCRLVAKKLQESVTRTWTPNLDTKQCERQRVSLRPFSQQWPMRTALGLYTVGQYESTESLLVVTPNQSQYGTVHIIKELCKAQWKPIKMRPVKNAVPLNESVLPQDTGHAVDSAAARLCSPVHPAAHGPGHLPAQALLGSGPQRHACHPALPGPGLAPCAGGCCDCPP